MINVVANNPFICNIKVDSYHVNHAKHEILMQATNELEEKVEIDFKETLTYYFETLCKSNAVQDMHEMSISDFLTEYLDLVI